MNKPTIAEIRDAQVGPRDLKNPRSRAYAIQTIKCLKHYAESLKCDQVRVKRELDVIDQYRHWEILGYATKDALLRSELNEVGIRNMQAVLDSAPELKTAIEAGKLGGRGKKASSDATGFGRDVTYLAARIKRDRPDIGKRIEAGEFTSMRQAAIAAGIVKVLTPMEQIQRLVKRLSSDELKTLQTWLSQL